MKKVLLPLLYSVLLTIGFIFLQNILFVGIVSFIESIFNLHFKIGFLVGELASSVIVFVLIFIFYIKRNRTSNFNKVQIDIKNIFLLLTIFFVTLFVNEFIRSVRIDMPRSTSEVDIITKGLVFINTFIVASISEELLFRGIVFHSLLRKFNIFFSIIIASLLYTVIHIGPNGINELELIRFFFLGIILCIVYWYFGLAYSILLHSLTNLLWFVTKYEMIEILNFPGIESHRIMYIFFALIVLVFLIVYIFRERERKYNKFKS